MSAETAGMTKDYYPGDTVRRFIRDMGMQFDEGCVVKYVARAGRKPGVSRRSDLEKARHYLDMLLSDLVETESTLAASSEFREWVGMWGADTWPSQTPTSPVYPAAVNEGSEHDD